jgi:hypothetical protein
VRPVLCLLILLLATGLAGCQLPSIDPKIGAVAKAAFDDVRRGDGAALDGLLAPSLKTPDQRAKLAQIKAYVPNREPKGRNTVGWNLVELPQGEAKVDVSDEYDFGDRMILWNTHLHRASAVAPWEVDGFHINSAPTGDLAANNFTFAHRSPLQYAFLALAILSPALMVAALVKVIRTKDLRRKWLWGIAAFVGVFSFQMNWATGQIFPNFLTVQLIGAGATRGPSAFLAWVLTMTVPIGAVLILTGVWANPRRAATQAKRKSSPPAPA